MLCLGVKLLDSTFMYFSRQWFSHIIPILAKHECVHHSAAVAQPALPCPSLPGPRLLDAAGT
jgi:hypothetical protein